MNPKLRVGICGWGNVATGLFEQLTKPSNEHAFELVCIGARRDNPNCDPGDVTVHRGIFEVIDQDIDVLIELIGGTDTCLLYTSPSPRDRQKSRMPSSA